jgi:hypothetical protein
MKGNPFDDDLGADDNTQEPPGSDVGDGMGTGRLLHEFPANKAVVPLDQFRIQRFVGLEQPIKLTTPTERIRKPGCRVAGVEKRHKK